MKCVLVDWGLNLMQVPEEITSQYMQALTEALTAIHRSGADPENFLAALSSAEAVRELASIQLKYAAAVALIKMKPEHALSYYAGEGDMGDMLNKQRLELLKEIESLTEATGKMADHITDSGEYFSFASKLSLATHVFQRAAVIQLMADLADDTNNTDIESGGSTYSDNPFED